MVTCLSEVRFGFLVFLPSNSDVAEMRLHRRHIHVGDGLPVGRTIELQGLDKVFYRTFVLAATFDDPSQLLQRGSSPSQGEGATRDTQSLRVV